MSRTSTALLPEALRHGHFFSLPNEIFELGLKPGELAVYCYLRRCADRETYQCWPSYKTIGAAVGMSFNTVRKNVCALADKGLIRTEDTSITDRRGMTWNGNLKYSHITDEMRRSAAAKIDQGIVKAEPQPDTESKSKERTMTAFRPTTGKRRKWGTGSMEQLKSGGWRGESTITMPDGTKKRRVVHADTEDECETLLARAIAEMRAEAAAERERLAIEKAS